MTETPVPPAVEDGPRRTALHAVHEALRAQFTDFGGWDMPLKYANDVAEHQAVREAAGLFDLSHMGEIRVRGPQAADLLDHALVSAFGALAVGRAKYSLMATEDGGVVDDLITYRLAERDYLVVPNAANVDAVLRELTVRGVGFDAEVADESAASALVALQGPAAVEILGDALEELHLADGGTELSGLRYYACAPAVVGGIDVLLARTGYTGEDGFELYVAREQAEQLWSVLAQAGESRGVMPAGLAARDSLRREAGMPLYGHELGARISPYAAGLGGLVRAGLKAKEDFVGRAGLEGAGERAEAEDARVLVGLRGLAKRPARAGAAIVEDGQTIGEVTSGIPSPTLGHPIAMAFLRADRAEPGTEVTVDIRGKHAQFEVVPLPFYRRER